MESTLHFIQSEGKTYISHGFYISEEQSHNTFLFEHDSNLKIKEVYIINPFEQKSWKPAKVHSLNASKSRIITQEKSLIYGSILYEGASNNEYILCQEKEKNKRIIIMISPASGTLSINGKEITKMENSDKNFRYSIFHPQKKCNSYHFFSRQEINQTKKNSPLYYNPSEKKFIQKTTLNLAEGAWVAIIMTLFFITLFYFVKKK